MSEAVRNTETNESTTYKFRFNTSNHLIQLTEQELPLIPYLSAFVAHKDDFSSIQNDQNEYILHSPIHYNWFMAIFRSLSTEQPYALFNELPTDDNILDVLQLIDYLGTQSFPPPLLRESNIIFLNSIKYRAEEWRVKYQRAKNLSDVRNTAAGFVLSLTKNEYDLNDSKIIECIFSLISIIFTRRDVFSLRFRYHTYTILEEYVFSLFFNEQSMQLLATMVHNETVDSDIYLYDDTQPLPRNFENAFVWKGIYQKDELLSSIEEIYNKELSRRIQENCSYESLRRFKIIIFEPSPRMGKSAFINYLLWNTENRSSDVSSSSAMVKSVSRPTFIIQDTSRLSELIFHKRTTSTMANRVPTKICVDEAQFARRGYFNTLPKRPKVDKFKNRYGPKAQKYR